MCVALYTCLTEDYSQGRSEDGVKLSSPFLFLPFLFFFFLFFLFLLVGESVLTMGLDFFFEYQMLFKVRFFFFFGPPCSFGASTVMFSH